MPGHLSGASSQICAHRLVFDQLGGLLEVALCLGRRREALRALARACQRSRCPCLQLLSVVGVRDRLVGGEQVGCDHLRDLVLRERPGQLIGGGEVAALAVAPREGLVGDPAHEVLQEAVLAVLGRARIGLDREHLLAHEDGEKRLEPRLVQSGEGGKRLARERLAEHRETRSDERVQRLGDLERLDLADDAVGGSLLRDQPAVEKHAHGFDRVQRNAFGSLEDLTAQRLGHSGHKAREQFLHRRLRQGLEVDGREAALSRAPRRPLLDELGPGEGDHVEPVAA